MGIRIRQMFALGVLLSMPWLVGCTGYQGTYSVSPATFLMPGVMENVSDSLPVESPERDRPALYDPEFIGD